MTAKEFLKAFSHNDKYGLRSELEKNNTDNMVYGIMAAFAKLKEVKIFRNR